MQYDHNCIDIKMRVVFTLKNKNIKQQLFYYISADK